MGAIADLVRDQLETTLYRQAWQSQPSLTEALEGVDAPTAAWRPGPQRHSIWQIVRHLILWKQGILRALEGEPPDREELRRVDWAEAGGSEDAWRADVDTLLRTSSELIGRARGMEDAALLRPVVWYRGWTETQPIAARLLRRATHDSYHTGQIRYLRALQSR